MLSISQKIVYVNSRQRISGSGSSFTYDLQIPPLNEYSHACVLDISIPKSYYLVSASRNTFTLIEGKVVVLVTVPAGNYTVKSIISTVSALLTAASPTGAAYTMAYPSASEPDTGKFLFTVTPSPGAALSFADNNIADILGFERNSENAFIAAGGSATVVSSKVIDLQNEQTLYLHSNLVKSDTDDILQEVFATNDPAFGRIVWQCTAPELSSKTMATRSGSASVFSFNLTDEDGGNIDLNGQDMQFTLCLYQKTKVSEIVTRAIKLNAFASLRL